MTRELNIIVMPAGTLNLEWTEISGAVSQGASMVEEEIFSRFSDSDYSWLLFTGFCDPNVNLSDSLSFFRGFVREFIHKLSRIQDLELLREKVKVDVEEAELKQILDSAPMMIGSEYLNTEIFSGLWERLNHEFCKAIRNFEGTVEDFFHSYSPLINLVGRIFFHLVENNQGDYPFAFLATYSTSLDKTGKSKHLPLRYALKEYETDSEKLLELLATVHRASNQSSFIAGKLDSGEIFHPQSWTAEEAYTFLKEIPVYENAGILCRIPNWWKGAGSNVRLSINVGERPPSHVGMNAILDFNFKLLLGGMEITESEAMKLLEESEGLAFIKNKWIAVDPEKLKEALEAYKRAKKMMLKKGLTLRECLMLELSPEKVLGIEVDKERIGINRGNWLEQIMLKLLDPEKLVKAAPGDGFRATLRPYQQKGLNWLCFLHSLKLGMCLADDMGLGKTIQLLGFLSVLKRRNNSNGDKKRASLLIVPASIIANWCNEIQKFYPALSHVVAHPGFGQQGELPDALENFDLVITTYSMAQRYEWLQSYEWEYVILDEAQAIKNPATKQTKAVKMLKPENRIIMTGTPVENRLSDLWSLFDFLNPGLLGNATEFTKFSKNLKNDSSGYARLRKIVSPYILRRLKTDRKVIRDLPDKVEMKTYASLSKKQILLYEQLVQKIMDTLELADGIQRKGVILSSIMKFKQICNHPDQYLASNTFVEEESGKFIRLREICEIIYEKREKALVFTQFKEMTEPLAAFLGTIFSRKGLVLHGSVPVAKRRELIDRFQSQEYVPFMVLSLKAGGVGLNLTEANHVIHFDRWWNPAVENQATDRAFRIGQKKNVVVHKFLTKGTIEEKIDKMIEEKLKLSEEVIASTGEAWITELGTRELMDLFKLSL